VVQTEVSTVPGGLALAFCGYVPSMSSPARRRLLVVAGLLADPHGKVLFSQRRADQAHPLAWELPGGKLEDGESPEVALARELREELAVEVAVGPVWEVLFHAYPDFDVLMLVYPCRLAAGQVPRCAQVADLAWRVPGDLEGLAVLPADAPLVERLATEGLPPYLRTPG
jgi:8-oxo-dGTP diphosphatase